MTGLLKKRLPAVASYTVGLGVAVLLVLVTVAGALWQVERAAALNETVRDRVDIRSHYRLFLRGLQDAETGQRGYLLTRNERYLAPFEAGRAEVWRELSLIEAQATDPDRQAEAALARIEHQKAR